MSLELRDVRTKLSVEQICMLTAYAEAHGQEMSELIRDIIEKWARRQIHAASLYSRALQREGLGAPHEVQTGADTVTGLQPDFLKGQR